MDYIFEYILENYGKLKNSENLKIAELGVGFYFDVSKKLKNSGFDIIVIDLNEKAVLEADQNGLNGKLDNLFNPDLNLYKDVKLIYSIRPPRDLQPFILDIAKKISSDLVIKPLSGEEPISNLKLVNYKGKPLYIWKKG